MARIGYLKRDQQEKGNGKPGYSMRAAWRVIGKDGRDMFQPWASTRREAKETARELGIDLQSEEIVIAESMKERGECLACGRADAGNHLAGCPMRHR